MKLEGCLAKMFKEILVPVDLTDKNLSAVSAALDLATPGETTITLLHVIEVIADADFEELADFYQRLEEKAGRAMAELAEPLAEAGIPCRQRIVYGPRARCIIDFASELEPDLIVLSSRRVDPDHPVDSWPTLSHQVAFFAQFPVLLVK